MPKMPLVSRIAAHFRKHKRFWLSSCVAMLLATCCVKQFGHWGAATVEKEVVTVSGETINGMGPLKIAFFSDIHNNAALFEQAIEIIKQEKPDLIIFGGDLILTNERFMRTKWAVNGFKQLAEIAPVYAILGNQDYEKLDSVERVLKTAGVTLLRNSAVDWTTPAGKEIKIVGLGDYNEGDEAPQVCLSPQGGESKPVLLLSHDPESRALLTEYDWDLMLSGHTHGGQLGVPFTDKYLSFRSSMPAGLFDFDGNRKIYVTRGVGAILYMRFFCTPEVTIITIPGGENH